MNVTFELDEDYTGTRTMVVPDQQNFTTEEISVETVSVTFTNGSITLQKEVRVVKDESGVYDHEATLERCREQARGIYEKIKIGKLGV